MDAFIENITRNATTVQKGLFLLVAGVIFVFVVQTVFYLVVRLWPKGSKAKG
jgi:Na+-transporting methylmalonyl-CoA/oxaloacetate decarboxylase gamma subunit